MGLFSPPKSLFLGIIYYMVLFFGPGFILVSIGNSMEKDVSTAKLGQLIARLGFLWPVLCMLYLAIFTNDVTGVGKMVKDINDFAPRR